MHNNNVHYISHGHAKTGGYRHEMMLSNYLAKTLNTELTVLRYPGQVKGFWAFIKLWCYAFKQATATLNITVQRLAFPVMLACLLRRKKMIVVWHHYHQQQAHSLFYHINAKLILYLLKSGWASIKVVVVSMYWKNWLLDNGVPLQQIQVVPNLFDAEMYQSQAKNSAKDRAICFGQFGVKQSSDIFELINALNGLGYHCYFTTPDAAEAKVTPTYAVLHLTYQAYLNKLASSCYTVCFSAFPEGWNRLAHESILLGTPVIGNDAGGLGELLNEAQQLIISHPMEALQLITAGKKNSLPDGFVNKYDIKQIPYYADSLVVFTKHAIC